MKWLIPAALTAAAAYTLARRGMDADEASQDSSEEADQLPTFWESVQVDINPMNYIAADTPQDQAARNERAFLDMIAYSEGTNGADGYRYQFGYPRYPDRLCKSLDDHPHQFFAFTNGRGEVLKTSAAGRYQFLGKTWDALKAKLDLPDFGPASQDSAALELIRQRGALNDVRAGRTAQAIAKCAPVWASLPGAGYAQPERKLTSLIAQYREAGGTMEA